MYAKKVYFNDTLKARKGVNGFYSSWPASSGVGSSGNITLQWNNIQSLSLKHFMTDFMVNLEFDIDFTLTAATTQAREIYLNKDINNAFSTLVTLSGGLSRENPGYICNLFKAYSEKYKSVPDLDKQGLYTYSTTSTGCSEGGRGIQIASGASGDKKFHIKTSVPLYHEFLINGVGGLTGLSIRINVVNNLINLIATTEPVSNITGLTATCTKASITYANYETNSETFDILVPHFDVFFVKIDAGKGSAQTRSTESCPNSVFNFIAQNPTTAALTVYNLQKPLKIDSAKVIINGNANAFNTDGDYENYARCKAYTTCPYLGSFTDWMTQDTYNEFGCVLKIDNGYLPLNQGDHSTFRYATEMTCTPGSYPNLYLFTVYMYAALLHMSPTGCECKFATDLIGEVDEYDDLDDDLLIGGSLFGRFKSWFKSGGPSRLIDKASKIVDVVAPNSGVSQGLNKASQISNILTGNSTSIF